MPKSKRDAKRRAALATRGGILLCPTGTSHKVRNMETGRVLPCCWSDCEKDGDQRIRVEIPHDAPRWRDETTGKQEMLVYIFCSDFHKGLWLKDTPHENRA